MCILRVNPTVLVALSVPLLHIQPVEFPVLFVTADLAVQRKIYKNSKALSLTIKLTALLLGLFTDGLISYERACGKLFVKVRQSRRIPYWHPSEGY